MAAAAWRRSTFTDWRSPVRNSQKSAAACAEAAMATAPASPMR